MKIVLTLWKTTTSDNSQAGAIQAIYRQKMVAVIGRWEWHITAAGPDVAPDVSKEELAQFQSWVSNLDNVREFMERWAREDRDVEEGLGEGGEGEGERDDKSDNLEIVISDDDDEDDEIADFIVDDTVEDEEYHGTNLYVIGLPRD